MSVPPIALFYRKIPSLECREIVNLSSDRSHRLSRFYIDDFPQTCYNITFIGSFSFPLTVPKSPPDKGDLGGS